MKRDFEFDGSGFGYLWLCIWTTVLTVITCGLFFPWAYSDAAALDLQQHLR